MKIPTLNPSAARIAQSFFGPSSAQAYDFGRRKPSGQSQEEDYSMQRDEGVNEPNEDFFGCQVLTNTRDLYAEEQEDFAKQKNPTSLQLPNSSHMRKLSFERRLSGEQA